MYRNILFSIFFILSLAGKNAFSQDHHAGKSTDAGNELPAQPVKIAEQLEIFNTELQDARYRISICADVPDNKNPLKVAHHRESGHVFLILQKMNHHDTINKVFGFYPKLGLPVLFFKKIKNKIKDNSAREYDVVISKQLTAEEFDTVLSTTIRYSSYRYHINKFNCYDFAIEIFNSIARSNPLPLTHTRFPFIYGRGGSPVCVYKDMKKLKDSGSVWASNIEFGNFTAPVSTGRRHVKER